MDESAAMPKALPQLSLIKAVIMRSFINSIANLMALLGGFVLTCLIVLTCLSVLGRGLNTAFHGFLGDFFPGFSAEMLALGIGPINGDFELVEAGMAFAVFAFLPYCQLKNGHAVVDVFTSFWPVSVQAAWQTIIEIVFAAVVLLLTYQLFQGMLSKRAYGETTFLLQFPIWWSYALSLAAASVASLVATYKAVTAIRSPWTSEEDF